MYVCLADTHVWLMKCLSINRKSIVKGIAANDSVTVSNYERVGDAIRKCKERVESADETCIKSSSMPPREALSLASRWRGSRASMSDSWGVIVNGNAVVGSAVVGNCWGGAREPAKS
jgi:hypothetical protein